MRKIFFVILLIIGSLLITSCTKEEKIYRVGVLWTGGEALGGILDSFKEEMTELGYIEDKNIVYEVYMAPLPVGNEQVVQKYVDEKVDLIFTFATEASIEAKKVSEGSGIPIVFTCTFIEGTGLVTSISTPGDTITGVRYPTTESAVGRLEFLHVISPNAKRIFVPYLKGYPTAFPQIEAIRPFALELNLTLIEGSFGTPQEVKDYLDKRAASDDKGMDAILMIAEPFSITPEVFNEIYKFGDEYNLPISSFMVLNDAYGPIVGFHPTNAKMGSLAAIQAHKVLKGIPAGNLPVFTSDNNLHINYKLAQKLNLSVPEGLLAMANEVIR